MGSSRGRTALAASVVITVIGLTACSAKSGTGGTATSGGRADASAVPAVAAGGAAGPELAPATGSGSADKSAPATTASLNLPGNSVIRTAQLSVAVAHARDVAGRADRAGVIAESVGGEVEADNRTSGTHAQADLVLRVPPQDLSAVLDQLGKLGTERSREMSTTDVTEKVADVDSRVRSAQAAIARLRAIYADATKIADVLAVEDDLSSRESDLEALQAQQRALSRQTSMATITLSLQTASRTAPPPKSSSSGGFVNGLERGWHAFTSAASSVASGFGAALPFLVLVILLGVAGRVVWGRRAPRPGPTPDSSA